MPHSEPLLTGEDNVSPLWWLVQHKGYLGAQLVNCLFSSKALQITSALIAVLRSEIRCSHYQVTLATNCKITPKKKVSWAYSVSIWVFDEHRFTSHQNVKRNLMLIGYIMFFVSHQNEKKNYSNSEYHPLDSWHFSQIINNRPNGSYQCSGYLETTFLSPIQWRDGSVLWERMMWNP